MADNLQTEAVVSAGATIASDDIGGTHYPITKIAVGALDAVTLISDSDPLPIDDAGGSLTVDNDGTFVVQVDGDALTSLQLIDDIVYTDDADWTALTSKHALMGGLYQSAPGTVTDGDVGPFRMDANGAIHINDGGNSITIDGTVTANLSATDNAVLDQIEVNTSYGDQTGGGTEASALRVTIANDSTGTLTVDNAGNFATQVDGDALTALQLIDDPVFADDEAFTLASSKVMMSGAIRDDSLTTLTAVEGDAVPLRVNSTGALHVTGAGGGTQYQIDDVVGGTDTGTAMLVQRDDTLTTLTPADGDYTVLRVSSTGALHVTDAGASGGTPNLVSTTNSTTTPLGIGASFAPTNGEDVSAYTSVTITLYADVASATDGMTFEFCEDNSFGANTDTYSFTMAAGGIRRFQFPVTAQYFRVNYTNGGTGQTTFTVQTILHRNNVLTSIHRLSDDMSPDRSAQVVKSVLFAQAAGSGDFTSIDATAGGNLKVALEENGAGNLTTNTVQLGGSAIDLGAGNIGSATQRVVLATDQASVTVDNAGLTELAAAINANELDVNIASSNATVTVDLGANNDVTIDNSNVVYTHDAAGGTANGIMGVSQRDDEVGATAISTADGDAQSFRSNRFGALKVTSMPDATSEVKYANISAAASGDNQLVAAAGAGVKIRVLALAMIARGDVDAYFRDDAGTPNDLMGDATNKLDLTANSGFVLPLNEYGWFETADNQELNVNLSAATAVVGCMAYVHV